MLQLQHQVDAPENSFIAADCRGPRMGHWIHGRWIFNDDAPVL